MKFLLKLFPCLFLLTLLVSTTSRFTYAQTAPFCSIDGQPQRADNLPNRRIQINLLNTLDDDIKVHVEARFTDNEKIKYQEDLTLAGKNTSWSRSNVPYYLPLPLKAPAGNYTIHLTTSSSDLYKDLKCQHSGEYTINVQDVPNNARDITSTLQNVENNTPFGSVGEILTALIPNIFTIAGLLGFAFLVFGGIRYALARGDAKATDAARGVITNAITGLIIVIVVFVIFEIISVVFKFSIFSLVPVAQAQNSVDIGQTVKLGTTPIKFAFPDVASLVTAIVAAATAIMGLIFFFLLIWGGIRYMFSRGDEKATQAARAVLTSAAIGLLIVISAFAIITLIGLFTGLDLLP